MKEENNNVDNNNNNSTCPPIKIEMHQNSLNKNTNTETGKKHNK